MNDNEKANILNNNKNINANEYSLILNQTIDKIYNQQAKDIREKSIKELKEWVIRTSAYQWDFKNIKFDNLSKEQNDFIDEYNFKNKMVNNHLVNTRIKLEQGKSVLAWRIGNGKLIPEIGELMGTPKEDNGELIEVFITKNYITQLNSETQITFYKYYKQQGKVYVQTYVAPFNNGIKNNPKGDDKYKQGKAYLFPNIDYLPLEIFYANEKGCPEWKFVENSIDMAGTFNKQLKIEWEYIKVQLMNNLNFNPTKTSLEVQQEIEGNKTRVHDMYDPDGMVQQSLSYLTNGGLTAEIAKNIIDYYKNQIKEFLFMISRTGGGNNKHTTEALNDNINAYSWIWTKKSLLTEEIGRIYYKWADMSNKYNFISFGKLPKYFKGEIQLSRSLEMLLNLNAEGKEQDNLTNKLIVEKENKGNEV